jgi:hypothetical protein
MAHFALSCIEYAHEKHATPSSGQRFGDTVYSEYVEK